MNAGELDQRVMIKRKTDVDDGQGGSAPTEVTVGTVWAKIEPVRGQERVIADRQAGTQTYRITARNQGHWAGVVTTDTLVWNGSEMNVRTAPAAGRDMYRMIEAEIGVVNS